MNLTTRNIGPKNAQQNQAKKAKQDEFYTQRSDIEKELVHYKRHFLLLRAND